MAILISIVKFQIVLFEIYILVDKTLELRHIS